MTRRTHIIGSILVALVAIAAALLCGEALTRYVFRHITGTASGGNYFTRQGPPIHVNTWGYRDREFTVTKPAGVYRIVMIGDSLGNGAGLPESDRFTTLLDHQLRGGGGEVLNLALPGQDLPEYLRALEEDAVRLDPDFVLLQMFVNDFEDPDTPRPAPSASAWSGVHQWLVKRSALYTVAAIELGTIEGEIGAVESYAHHMRAALADPNSTASQASTKRLLTFIRLCRDKHLPLAIVFFPHFAFDLGASYPFAYLHERVERICRDEHVPYLDLRPVFAGVRREDLQLNRFDAHPSAKAHRIAAAAMLRAFGAQWRRALDQPPNAEIYNFGVADRGNAARLVIFCDFSTHLYMTD